MSDGEDVQLRPFTFQTAGFDARFPNTNQVCHSARRFPQCFALPWNDKMWFCGTKEGETPWSEW